MDHIMTRDEYDITKLVRELYAKRGMCDSIQKVCNLAIRKKKSEFCCKLAEILYKEDVMQDLQKVVVIVGHPYWCEYFAKKVIGADTKALKRAANRGYSLAKKSRSVKEIEKDIDKYIDRINLTL